MAYFRIIVSMDDDQLANPATSDAELARILRETADKIEAHHTPGFRTVDEMGMNIRDVNGNVVGRAEFNLSLV